MKTLTSMRLVPFLMLAAFAAAFGQFEIKEEIRLAEAMLMDAAIRSDSEGVSQARSRFEPLLKNEAAMKNAELAAQVHYQIAFADFQLLYITFGQWPDSKKLAEEAMVHLNTAIQTKPDFTEAYTVSAFCSFYLSFFDRAQAETHKANAAQMLQKALTVEPENPRIYVAQAFSPIFSDMALSRKHALKAAALYEQQEPKQKSYADWWRVTPYYYLSSLNYYLGEPEKMREPIDKALALRPDFDAIVSSQLPFITPKAPVSTKRFEQVKWQLLAEDAEGDGQNPNLADGKALAYFYDRKADSLWFKIDLHKLPDPNVFGVNLVVDVDQNQATGLNWWGGNKNFTFDKLVTVWIIKGMDGKYYGPVGMTSAQYARRQRLTKLGENNLTFGVAATKKSIVIGFKRTDLDEARQMKFVAAVGSNVMWNDDLGAADGCTIELN
jgi:tetratricopeptide (TPR) repeat protein